MRCAVLAAACALAPSVAFAHGMRSGALRIDEIGDHRALVTWTQSIPAEIDLDFPPACTHTAAGPKSYVVECADGVAGATFAVNGLGPIITDATALVTFRDGRTASHVLLPDAPAFTIPKPESALDVARAHVGLGVEHILSGADHLMFLFLLVLLLGTKLRSILIAESAFTLSHSISFSLTALGIVEVAAPAAEACIALSLLLLAADVSDRRSATARSAAWTALIFGSVHGLGFAGGLRELGLPEQHVATALLGFGTGVEIGQVAFIAGTVAVLRILYRFHVGPRIARAATYLAGVSAAYWLAARLFVCLDS